MARTKRVETPEHKKARIEKAQAAAYASYQQRRFARYVEELSAAGWTCMPPRAVS